MQENTKLNSKNYSFLIISDIHYKLEYVQLLIQSGRNYDFVFCLGDIGNIKGDQFDSKLEVEEGKKRIYEIVLALEKLSNIHLFYILGNHDHFSMLSERDGFEEVINSQYECNLDLDKNHIQESNSTYKWNSEKRTLLHSQVYDNPQIFPITIFAHGGSPPGYFINDPSKPRIKGYPFESREEFNQELDSTMQQIQFSSLREKQSIWLTHCGPTESKSSVALLSDGVVESGSERYRYWIKKWMENAEILGWFHGHCHSGYGVYTVSLKSDSQNLNLDSELKLQNSSKTEIENVTHSHSGSECPPQGSSIHESHSAPEEIKIYNSAAFVDGKFITGFLSLHDSKWSIQKVKLETIDEL